MSFCQNGFYGINIARGDLYTPGVGATVSYNYMSANGASRIIGGYVVSYNTSTSNAFDGIQSAINMRV